MKLPDIIIKIDNTLRDLIQEFLAKIAKIPPRKPQIEPIPARSIEAIRERARRLVLLSTPTVNIDYSSGRLTFDSLPIALEHKAISWGKELRKKFLDQAKKRRNRFRMKRKARQLMARGRRKREKLFFFFRGNCKECSKRACKRKWSKDFLFNRRPR